MKRRRVVMSLLLIAAMAVAADGPKKADPDALRQAAMNNGGNAERGKAVFASVKAACATCHKAQGVGGDTGPDLSQIGGKFDRTHLIESVLDPSAEILQGYQTTAIETKSGRVYNGIVKSESSTAVTLADAQGNLTTIPLRDIESRAVSKLSLMPVGLAEVMTPAEFTDLIAYLESLRTGRKPTPGEGVTGTLTLPAGFRAEVVAAGLTGATAFEAAPDGRIFVCEQTGTLRIIKDGKLLAGPFVLLQVDATWERGLIGVTVAPDFPKTPHVFVCYVAARPYPHHVVSRFTAAGDAAEPGSEKILFEGDDQSKLGGDVPAGHQGGAVHFGKDGKLYVAIGDQTAGKPAQDLHSLLGKMLRINPDGSVPDDNPFVAKTDGKYRAIWALGLRNPFTFAMQPGTGRLFINDVGGRAEEVNEGVAGANYGWPVIDHGPTADPRFRGPIHHYPTACVCGGAFSPAGVDWPKEYRGRYFFGDFNHGCLRVIDPDNPATASTFATGLRRPVDLRFGPDGSLYVLLRDAWVMDKSFRGGTGVVLRIRHVEGRDREVRELVEFLSHTGYYGLRDPKEREAVAKLQKLGEYAAAPVAAMLTDGLKNRGNGWIEVYRPLYILKGMGEHAKVALPDVIKSLDDEHGINVGAAADVLAAIGPAAKDALPALLKAWGKSEKSSGYTCTALAAALQKIDPEAAEKAGIMRK
jgi:putative heme-binding domain-containing protein